MQTQDKNGGAESPFKIIAVDDECGILEVYEQSLTAAGFPGHTLSTTSAAFEIHTCRQGDEAVAAVEKALLNGGGFSVAFIDMHMPPGPDGLETAEQIRRIDGDIEIMIVTGYSGIDLDAFARRVPPMDKFLYLQKPLHVEEIRQFAQSLSAKWQAGRRYRQIKQHLDQRVEKRTRQLKQSVEALGRESERRARVEASLRANEAKFRNIINNSADAILILDAKGSIRFVNPAGETLLMRRKEECVGTMFGFPIDLGKRTDINLVRPDGKPVYAEMRVVETEWEGENCFLAVLRDITSRRMAETDLKTSIANLQKTMHGTVEAISLAVETRDPYTAGHQKRVANLALAIADEMALDPHRSEGLHMAAMIHDLGKLATPSDLLSKPTRLSDPEFELIKTHASKGHDIINGIDFPWPVADIIMQHHEKLDGSGYPRGIGAGQILLESKILTVADVVEAMASHRPYRPALGIETALDEIRSKRARHYDPVVVDACVTLFTRKSYRLDMDREP